MLKKNRFFPSRGNVINKIDIAHMYMLAAEVCNLTLRVIVNGWFLKPLS